MNSDLFMSGETIDTIVNEFKKELERQQNNILSEMVDENQKIINEVSRRNEELSPKAAENILFQKLHELIMTKYIKKRYREGELSNQTIEVYFDLLIHDWAEIDVRDAVPREDTEKRRELEDFRMRILLMHEKVPLILMVKVHMN